MTMCGWWDFVVCWSGVCIGLIVLMWGWVVVNILLFADLFVLLILPLGFMCLGFYVSYALFSRYSVFVVL